jgi:hypothetical protein
VLGAALLGDSEADTAERAVSALRWYANHVGLTGGTLRNVGNVWHHRDDPVDRWLGDDGDEQPLDAAAMTEALVDAWQFTGDAALARMAGTAFGWFLGRNRAGVPLYVEATGACQDGLSATAANPNQGAESTLAYYQALLSLLRAGLAALPHPAVPALSRSLKAPNVGRAAPSRLTSGRRSRTTEGHTDAR